MRRAQRNEISRLWLSALMVGGLLLQLFLLPAGSVAEPTDPLWALGSICHALGGDGGPHHPPAQGQDRAHCPLCQSGTVAFLVPEQPPLLRVAAIHLVRHVQAAMPSWRGPHRPAYASRAPPAIV
jgi:hypothetical protein